MKNTKYNIQNTKHPAGFTLIEIIVAVGIFVVVALIAVGSLLAVVGADRKAQSIQSVVNNLNFALDDMSRIIDTGSRFSCLDSSGTSIPPLTGTLTTPTDCSVSGSSYVALEPAVSNQSGGVTVYWFSSPNCYSDASYPGSCIERSIDGGTTYQALTSPDITINDLKFFVSGVALSDTTQPRVVMRMTASFQLQAAGLTTMHLQSTITQRAYGPQ